MLEVAGETVSLLPPHADREAELSGGMDKLPNQIQTLANQIQTLAVAEGYRQAIGIIRWFLNEQ